MDTVISTADAVHSNRYWEVHGCPESLVTEGDSRFFWRNDAIALVIAGHEQAAIERAMDKLLAKFVFYPIGGGFSVHAREVSEAEAFDFWTIDELEEEEVAS